MFISDLELWRTYWECVYRPHTVFICSFTAAVCYLWGRKSQVSHRPAGRSRPAVRVCYYVSAIIYLFIFRRNVQSVMFSTWELPTILVINIFGLFICLLVLCFSSPGCSCSICCQSYFSRSYLPFISSMTSWYFFEFLKNHQNTPSVWVVSLFKAPQSHCFCSSHIPSCHCYLSQILAIFLSCCLCCCFVLPGPTPGFQQGIQRVSPQALPGGSRVLQSHPVVLGRAAADGGLCSHQVQTPS